MYVLLIRSDPRGGVLTQTTHRGYLQRIFLGVSSEVNVFWGYLYGYRGQNSHWSNQSPAKQYQVSRQAVWILEYV